MFQWSKNKEIESDHNNKAKGQKKDSKKWTRNFEEVIIRMKAVSLLLV